MKAVRLYLLVFMLVGTIGTSRAAEILVKNGKDGILAPPEGSLRAAIESAHAGDTVRFESPVTVLLEDDLNIPDTLSGLLIEGPGQIRGKPIREGPNHETQEFESLNVLA